MPKDFATSWEQAAWKNACHSHAFYKRILLTTKSDFARELCQKRISEIEAEYPMLREEAPDPQGA